MATRVEKQLLGEIGIDAPREKVWALVSEVRNAPLWSFQARKVVAFGGATRLGTFSLNYNRRGWVLWPTWAKVTDFRPGERFANEVGMAGARWVFELEDAPGSTPGSPTTLLREYRETFYPRGFVAGRIVTPVMGGEEKYNAFMEPGTSQSLRTIKDLVEGA